MSKTIETHAVFLELAEAVPAEIPAGTVLSLALRIWSDTGVDLQGMDVLLMSGEDVVASGTVSGFDEGVNSAVLEARVPDEAGEHAWTVVFPACGNDEVVYEEASLPVSFATAAHAVRVTVWGISSPAMAGARLSLTVGARCACGCDLAGRRVHVRDGDGKRLATVRLGSQPWNGTDALFWATARVEGPAVAGIHAWSAWFPADAAAPAHAEGAAGFGLNVTARPEHRLTVKVIEKASAQPLASAEIRLGAFRAMTDETGVACVDMPAGTFDLAAWKVGYSSPVEAVEVTGDRTVELLVSAILQENPDERWG